MKNTLKITKSSDSKIIKVINSNDEETLVQCDDCEIAFKSEYHLENHMKSSQHLIKSGLNRKFGYKLNHKTAKNKLLKGASRNPLVKEVKSSCEILNLNDGAYFVSVLPLIEQWKLKQEAEVLFNYNDLDIYITDFTCASDASDG